VVLSMNIIISLRSRFLYCNFKLRSRQSDFTGEYEYIRKIKTKT